MYLKEAFYQLPNTVLVGSAALGIPSRDVDIAVYRGEVGTLLTPMQEVQTSQYDEESPLVRNSTLYTFDGLDVFVFEDLRYALPLEATMVSMRKWPKWLISIKWVRIKAFRYYLWKYEFYDA